MGFVEFIRSKLIGKKSYEISAKDFEKYYSMRATEFHLTEIALFTAISLVAKSVAKCEFVTVEENKEIRKSEYYRWNYQPNLHQTKAEFIAQFISNLIFHNEALIFETANGQLLVADSFAKTEKALYEDTFYNVTARGWTSGKVYTSKEVIYLKYSNIALSDLLSNMCNSFEKLMSAAGTKYRNSSGHKGILNVDDVAREDEQFNADFEELMNVRFKAYFDNPNAVLPLFKGFEYEELPANNSKVTNSEINDIQKLKKEIFSTVGNVIHVPPALMDGTASQLSDAVDTFIADAIDPITNMLEQAATIALYGESGFIKGNYMAIDTTYVRHIDAISQATNLDKSIACGMITPEKAQKYCNMVPSDEEFAKKYYMTKNYQTADMAVKGGENNA